MHALRKLADLFRRSAADDFRRTPTGRLMVEITTRARSGRLSADDVSRYSRRLQSVAGRRDAERILDQLGIREIEQAAQANGGSRGLFGGLRDILRPTANLLRSLSAPRIFGRRVSLAREMDAARAVLGHAGHVVIPPADDGGVSQADQERIADWLRASGWKVRQGDQDARRPGQRPSGRQRKTTDVDFGGPRLRQRVSNRDELVSGQMIRVESSNVHSIGFRLDRDSSAGARQSTGTLLIRFLGGSGGKRSGPGALYEYYDVPASVFEAFRAAASKGKFVWDDIRVRGTVSGHRYSYELAGIAGGYVPRQAGLRRGESGEFFMTRRFRDDSGTVFTSRLPERRVTGRGPNRASPGGSMTSR